MLHSSQASPWSGISKRKCSSWEQSQDTVLWICLWQKKKQMQTLLSNKTTFGMNANKTEGPTQSQFIPTGETHRSWHWSLCWGQLGKNPHACNSELLSGATLARHKGTSLVSSLFNMAQPAWGSLNPVSQKWEPPLIPNWFHSVLNQQQRGCASREINGHFQKGAPNWLTARDPQLPPRSAAFRGFVCALKALVWR